MKKKNIIKASIIGFIIIVIDQVSKGLIRKYLTQSKILLPRVLELEIVDNTGIAFGMNSGNLKNIVITLIIIGLIIYFLISQRKMINKKTLYALSLMLAGGISNLIDRIIFGGVLDFIKISNFPIFNVADMSVVLGWLFLIINIIKFANGKEEV